VKTTIRGMLLASAILTSSCGDGQGGEASVPVVPGPTPTASPTPIPTPTPAQTSVTPVSLTFSSASVDALFDAAGAATVYPAVAGADAGSVVVSDPDAPAARSFEDLRLSGNETFGISRTEVSSSYSGLFPVANSTGSAILEFYSPGPTQMARTVALLGWKNGGSGSPAAELHLLQTQVEDVPVPNPPTSYLASHAGLLEAVFSDRKGIQIFGDATPASSWPKSNSLEYDGEVYGTAFTAAKEQLPYIGDATIYVDGAKSNAQLHGIIHISHFKGEANAGIPIEIDIVADVIAGRIVTRTLTVTGAGGMVESGSITGSFYGPTGDELGLVFSASGAPGSSIGGMILRLNT
jgi:hypothetical protein